MIVVDPSALIAILDKEPDAYLYAEAIAEADPPLISTATLLELNPNSAVETLRIVRS